MTGRARALVIVSVGAILIAAGVVLLAGLGWGLVTLGTLMILEALFMDTGTPPAAEAPERPPFAVRPR